MFKLRLQQIIKDIALQLDFQVIRVNIKETTIDPGHDVGKEKTMHTAGRNVNLLNHCGNQNGIFSGK